MLSLKWKRRRANLAAYRGYNMSDLRTGEMQTLTRPVAGETSSRCRAHETGVR